MDRVQPVARRGIQTGARAAPDRLIRGAYVDHHTLADVRDPKDLLNVLRELAQPRLALAQLCQDKLPLRRLPGQFADLAPQIELRRRCARPRPDQRCKLIVRELESKGGVHQGAIHTSHYSKERKVWKRWRY